ncbi:MAG: hypothetical protein MUD17_02585 [Gemmatimonadaceae bacterium]|jgi:hypothetical protein|nr:hypothetical protein [Gemmatimonadaceae bacterium]
MRGRRGVTLVPVIALLGATLLVAVAFVNRAFVADRATRLAWHGERALHAADAALLDALTRWPVDSAGALRPTEHDTLPHRPSPDLLTTVTRTRLSAGRYLLRANAASLEGTAVGGVASRDHASRALQRVVQLQWPRPPGPAPLLVFGALTLSDSATVVGVDTEPVDWTALCSADRRARPLPAIIADAITTDPTVVTVGDLPVTRVPLAVERAQLLTQFDAAFTALAARASHTTPDSVLDLDAMSHSCPRWLGDARRDASVPEACTRRWPIVRVSHTGVTYLRGRTPAQGVLLVDGDLSVASGVPLHGIVLVRGRLLAARTPGAPPAEFSGLVVARDQHGLGSHLAGTRVLAGQCAVRYALAAAGTPQPETRLGWHTRP